METTGNVHSLELTLPFPTPAAGAGTVFAIGRTFGDPAGGVDGLDVWVSDTATTTFDPPDGDALTLPLSSLLALTHGFLRFVPAAGTVPGLSDRTGAPLVVASAALVLSVWPTLRNNFELMAVDGSVLVPQVAAGRGGRPGLEHLVYENVDMTTLRAHIEALVLEARPDPPVGTADRAAIVDAFLAGSLSILARAGRVVGEAAAGAPAGATPPAAAGASWRRLTLRAVDRLGQLFDPGWLLRRIRELEAVVEIPLVVDKTLIPSRDAIRDHPLPALTPARRIVDWRDVHGRPRGGRSFFFELDGTDPDSAAAKATNAWGLWVGPTLPASGDPLAVDTLVVAADAEHVALATLPNAPRSALRLARQQLADDYLILSEVDLAEWFPERPAAVAPVEPLRRYTQGNRVTALVDGRAAHWEIFKALRRTFRDDRLDAVGPEGPLPAEGALLPETDRTGHRIYVSGWQLSPDLFLRDLPDDYVEIEFDASGISPPPGYDPRGHVMGVLRAAIDAGVEVRALLWRQLQAAPDFHSDNTAAVTALDAASATTPGSRGQAILDQVVRTVGSHHQKAVVLENADGRLAFLGGVDLALGRYDSDEHRPNDPRSQNGRRATPEAPWLGWHDVHCRIEGPAVDDVETNFRQRWNANPGASTGGRTPTPARATLLDPIPEASHFVQINRTFPSGVPLYDFVSQATGEPGALTARLNAIRHARTFVHIEEQYLTMVDAADYDALLLSPDPLAFSPARPDTLAAALRARLVGPDPLSFVTILIPKDLQEEPAFANMVLYEMRRRFIRFLTSA